MAKNEDSQLVIAVFDNYEMGELSIKALKNWDVKHDEIKLGAMGLLYQDEKGKIKTKKYGPLNIRRGAKMGLLLGVLVAVLPVVGLAAGAVAGAAAGGFAGIFSRKGLGLSEDELATLKSELAAGKAALVVFCDEDELEATKGELAWMGGKVANYRGAFEDKALEEAAQEVAAPPPDETES